MYPYGRGRHSRIFLFWALPLVLLSLSPRAHSGASQCLAEKDYIQMLHMDGESVWAGEDFSCFIGIDDINVDNSLVVDVRQAADYGLVRIPGSINLSPSELLHKPALKDRQLLLTNEGFSRSNLAGMCSALRKAGFQKLSILNGGLSSWFASGRPLIGSPGDRDQLFFITPEMLFTEAVYSAVSVLAPQAQTKRLLQIFPPNVLVLGVGQEDSLERALVSLLASRPEGRTMPVVLIGFDSSAIKIANEHRSVFVLDQSAHQIGLAYEKSRDLARSRLEVPERYRCRG